MNKVLIVEGPDGSGKTTLCDALVKEYGYERVHEGPPPAGVEPLDYYLRKLLKAFRGKKPVVFDRFHLGETVYGPLARDRDTLGLKGVTIVERVLNAHGGRLLLALPPLENARACWYDDVCAKNDFLSQNGRLNARELYYQSYKLFERWKSRYEVYDWTDPEQLAHQNEHGTVTFNSPRSVDLWLETVRSTAALPFGTVGSPTARFLVVGEQSSDLSIDLPFCSLTYSSGWLNDALRDAGFFEYDLAFTNALDVRGRRRNLRNVKKSLPLFRHAIALGRLAEEACGDDGLPATYVTHPSCAKRFSHGKYEYYVERLRHIKEAAC